MKKKDEARKKAEFKAGKSVGVSFLLGWLHLWVYPAVSYLFQLSGREMFTFNPALAAEDETEEEGEVAYDTRHLLQENLEVGTSVVCD